MELAAPIKCSGSVQYVWHFMVLYCSDLQLIHQQTNALNKVQFVVNINFLHVWARECHPQGVDHIKGI